MIASHSKERAAPARHQALVLDHLPLVYWAVARALRRLPALALVPRDDLIQEALVGCLKCARDWRPGGGASIATWLLWGVRGALSDLARRGRKQAPTPALRLEGLEGLGRDGRLPACYERSALLVAPSLALEEAEQAARARGLVEAALAALPPARARAVRLVYLEGRKQTQAAQLLGVCRQAISD